ncbi:MAG: hypothetical protein R3E68_02515 [Burkholderiaceae bacterium]
MFSRNVVTPRVTAPLPPSLRRDTMTGVPPVIVGDHLAIAVGPPRQPERDEPGGRPG